MEDPDQCLVHLRTSESVKARLLMEALQPILMEGSICFDKKGMHIRGLNRLLLVDTSIFGDRIDEYFYNRPNVEQTKVFVSFATLHSCLSSVSSDESLVIQLTKESMEASIPYINVFLVSAGAQSAIFSFRVTLLALSEDSFEIPDSNFERAVCIPSQSFQRVLRCCEKRGSDIQILTRTSDGVHSIIFATNGDDADLVIGMNFEAECDQTCLKKDRYLLKYLLLVAKATALSSFVTLYLKPDYVLAVKYHIGTIGEATFCLAPMFEKAEALPSMYAPVSCPAEEEQQAPKADDAAAPDPEPEPAPEEEPEPAPKRPIKRRRKALGKEVKPFSATNMVAGADRSSGGPGTLESLGFLTKGLSMP